MKMTREKYRFVVHEHKAKRAGLHYDLRLEKDGVLMDWAFRKEIPLNVGTKRFGVKQSNHSLVWLSFEGKIEDGYGAGEMTIWDKGTYEVIEESEHHMKFRFNGSKMNGEYVLVKFKNGWLIFKTR